jgi:hypothetical protein
MDIKSLNWKIYLENCWKGTKTHLLKEDLSAEKIEKARHKIVKYEILI